MKQCIDCEKTIKLLEKWIVDKDKLSEGFHNEWKDSLSQYYSWMADCCTELLSWLK